MAKVLKGVVAGIGLAIVCTHKGYPLEVTMAETFSVERRKLMRSPQIGSPFIVN